MSAETLRALDPRRALAGARTRVLLAFVVLLALSTLASTLALRQILLARAGERVEEALIQEVEEFTEQGESSGGDIRALFDRFLTRNVPAEGEAFFTFLDGRPYTSTEGAPSDRLLARVSRLGRITDTTRGEVTTADGDVRYLAVPVSIDGRRRGVFVVIAGRVLAPRSDGAGLGLAIVRAIAEAHGGHVELDSREGAGSTFTLVIPAEPSLQEVT